MHFSIPATISETVTLRYVADYKDQDYVTDFILFVMHFEWKLCMKVQ